jgi:hypothetical protein
MKKILLASFFLIITCTLTSCTADTIPVATQTAPINLDGDTGGQSGQLPPPKP